MTFGDCGVCGESIHDPGRATLMRDGVREEDDPGEARYRHVDCDPADTPRDESTTIEM